MRRLISWRFANVVSSYSIRVLTLNEEFSEKPDAGQKRRFGSGFMSMTLVSCVENTRSWRGRIRDLRGHAVPE